MIAVSMSELKEGDQVEVFTSSGAVTVEVESNVEQEDGSRTLTFRRAEGFTYLDARKQP